MKGEKWVTRHWPNGEGRARVSGIKNLSPPYMVGLVPRLLSLFTLHFSPFTVLPIDFVANFK